jgi:hypothetical protein
MNIYGTQMYLSDMREANNIVNNLNMPIELELLSRENQGLKVVLEDNNNRYSSLSESTYNCEYGLLSLLKLRSLH